MGIQGPNDQDDPGMDQERHTGDVVYFISLDADGQEGSMPPSDTPLIIVAIGSLSYEVESPDGTHYFVLDGDITDDPQVKRYLMLVSRTLTAEIDVDAVSLRDAYDQAKKEAEDMLNADYHVRAEHSVESVKIPDTEEDFIGIEIF